ncbi:putative ribosome biogenesis protein C8F11.04 [Aristolochia californica]|uniref:putative ribosome biogenesis protein C8F11.04 n=1 Tax=Aristolochia californica TaxID=171875 RepID=UPI0035D9FBB5
MASLEISSLISTETIGCAVTALLKWIQAQAKHQKAQLLEHDELIYLVLSLKKIPANSRTNPSKIPLLHPLHPLDGSEEICLIINDRQQGPNPLTSEDAKKRIQAESIPVSKVIKLSKLKTDYRPFEAKRKLCGSYDLFFADRTVLSHLPRLLGKHFFKKKKIPIPIDLSHKNWKAQIEHACSSALLYLRTGTCCILKIGRVSQGRDQLVENIAAAIEGAAKILPKGWANIRSLHLKSLESVALPLYQIVPATGLKIEVTKREEKGEEKKEENVKQIKNGEASTPKEEEKEKEKKKKKSSVKKGRIHEVRYMDGDINKLMEVLVGDDDTEVKEVNEVNVVHVVTEKEKKKKRMADEMAGTEKKKNRKATDDSIGAEKKKIKKKDEFPGELKGELQKPLKKTKNKGKLEQEALSTGNSAEGETVGSPKAVMKKIKAVKSGEEKIKSMKNKKK